MKLTQNRFARFESKGYPDLTQDSEGPLTLILPELAEWLMKVKMGSRIVVTIARNAEDLEPNKHAPDADMLAELNRIFNSEGIDDGHED